MRIVTKKGSQVLEAMATGSQQLLEAVGSTFGPAARAAVMLRRDYRPHRGWSDTGSVFTRDGGKLARSFFSGDPFEQVAIDLIAEAAQETEHTVGDGSTATAVLTAVLFTEAAKLVAAGNPPPVIVKGIRRALERSAEVISESAFAPRDSGFLLGIAKSASRGRYHEAEAVLEAIDKTGEDGFVEVGSGAKLAPSISFGEGFDISGSVVTTVGISILDKEAGQALLEPSLVFFDENLESAEAVSTLDQLLDSAAPPLVIFAKEFGQIHAANQTISVANSLASAARAKRVPLILVKGDYSSSPQWGDAASYSGTSLLPSVPDALDDVVIGRVAELTLRKEGFRAYGAQVDSAFYKAKVDYLRKIVRRPAAFSAGDEGGADRFDYQPRHRSATEMDQKRKRLAQLLGKYALVSLPIYGPTEQEEAINCMSNVLRSLEWAKATGCVHGGGEAYLRAASALATIDCPEVERFGIGVVRRALSQPLFWIAANAGKEPMTVVEEVEKLPAGRGFDAERDEYVDLKSAGVIDACDVVLCALRNAVSTACFMLGVSTIVGTVTGDEDLSEHDLGHMIRRRR